MSREDAPNIRGGGSNCCGCIWFSFEDDECTRYNFELKLEAMKTICDDWE